MTLRWRALECLHGGDLRHPQSGAAPASTKPASTRVQAATFSFPRLRRDRISENLASRADTAQGLAALRRERIGPQDELEALGNQCSDFEARLRAELKAFEQRRLRSRGCHDQWARRLPHGRHRHRHRHSSGQPLAHRSRVGLQANLAAPHLPPVKRIRRIQVVQRR